MKFVIVHNLLWSHYKAAVHSNIYRLAKEKNVDFKVIHIAKSRLNRKNMGEPNLKLHDYPYELLFDEFLENVPTLTRTRRLWKQIIKEKPDVLFMSYSDVAYYPILIWLNFSKIKLFLGFDSNYYDHQRKFLKETIKKIFLKIPTLIFSYGIMQQEYLAKLGVPASKMRIRVQGTNYKKILDKVEALKKNPTEWNYPKYTFLYVGRLSKEKNIPLLIEAFKKIEKPEWGLVIVGDGPQKESLMQNLEPSGNIFFTGGIPTDLTSKFYVNSSVFVLPSLNEPWGIVVNEAMWCSKPVLVSKHCGCSKDLVEQGKNGLTFDPLSLEDLVEKMNYFIENVDKFESLGQKSRDIISPYTDLNAANQIINEVVKFRP